MQNVKTVSQETILRHALEMFKMRGIKGVRMEDVSKELKISKRTIYEKFNDKEQLLMECVKLNAEIQAKKFSDYMAKTDNVMDILCFFVKNGLEELGKYNSKFFVEVFKYKAVREFLDKRAENDAAMKQVFFQRAIDEGLVVSGINLPLVAMANRAVIESFAKEKVYEKYSVQEMFRTFVMVFLRGIMTEKGQRELEGYLKGF